MKYIANRVQIQAVENGFMLTLTLYAVADVVLVAKDQAEMRALLNCIEFRTQLMDERSYSSVPQ